MTKVTRIDMRDNMISASLIYFQLIEESIRQYLKLVTEIISERSKDIPCNHEFYKDTDTLGTLISKFEKVNNNEKLIVELRELNRKRIEVVHKIFLHYMDKLSKTVTEAKDRTQEAINQALNEVAAGHVSNLQATLNNAVKCLSSLFAEQERLRAILEQRR